MPANKSNISGSKREKDGRSSMNRMTFLKALAFTVATSRIIKYPEISSLVSSQESAEGVLTERWIATSCLNYSTRCATQVGVVNRNAVNTVDNPLSQVSEGEICPRGPIGLQVLYDPSRASTLLKRTNPAKGREVDPKWVPISLSQALSEVSARLKSLRDKAQLHKLLLLHGLNTIGDEDMVYHFADTYEFGAGIVESEKPLARNLRMWGKIQRERPNRAKVVVINPRYKGDSEYGSNQGSTLEYSVC